MPVYNGEKYISKAIESVLRQNYENIELIISDDGSSDSSVEVASQYLSLKHSNVKILRNKHGGKVFAINKAYEVASGEAICLLAHDDVLETESIKERVDLIQKGNDFAFHNGNICDESLNPIVTFYRNKPKWINDKKMALKECSKNNLVSGGLFIINRFLSNRIFPLPNNLKFEDWWICFLGIYYSKSMGYSEKRLLNYRIHRGNDCGSPHITRVRANHYRRDWERHEPLYCELIDKMKKEKEIEIVDRLKVNATFTTRALKKELTVNDIQKLPILGIKKTLIGLLLSGYMNGALESFFSAYFKIRGWLAFGKDK